jgi:hypothetical protein
MHAAIPSDSKASTSFCEQKEAKKLFIHWSPGPRSGTPMDEVFCALFFKKTPLALASLP